MPTQIIKTSRRRAATPVTKKSNEDEVWRRVFEAMGLEPLSSSRNSSSTPTDTAAEAMADPTIPATGATATTILSLPREVQKEVFKHASSTDLISLSLVSKHFRNVAAEQLYRNFHIVFPDDDDPSNDSDIDGLAGGLDTFVTSEYDYAQYLREIVLETLSGGEKAEHAYRHYLYDVSCGKFMNTLLLLTLRKARALETFRWDIRVELSRQIFKTLHQIEALQHLHLRMQVGKSIYQEPPAIAPAPVIAIDLTSPAPTLHNAHSIAIPTMPPSYSSNLFSLAHVVSPKSNHKPKSVESVKVTPPTLSGFKDLKTLSILDMDSLEYINELKVCVRNCSSSLNILKLSFSEALANKSRKPPPEVQSDDDSDQEDEFGQIIVPGGPPPALAGASDPNAPSKALKAQEEKKKQEAVLGRILGMDSNATHKHKTPAVEKDETEKKKAEEDPKRRFIRNLAPLATKLMAHVSPGSEVTDAAKETLEMIKTASKLYLASTDKSKAKSKDIAQASGSSTTKVTPASSNAGMDDGADEAVMSGAAAEVDGPGLFDNDDKAKKKPTSSETGIADPEDIDVEGPEVTELVIEDELPEMVSEQEAEAEESRDALEHELANNSKEAIACAIELQYLESLTALTGSHQEFAKDYEELVKLIAEIRLKLQSADSDTVSLAEVELKKVVARYEDFARRMGELNDRVESMKLDTKPSPNTLTHDEMSEYVRTTRGLTLQTLAIYLIPVKASVLSKAIDVHVLQNITLLNVGSQTPFWNVLSRENSTSPLPLRKIYTDNVTLPFLVLVSQLEKVTELLLLERTSKARVESTAAKTAVTIEQIRKIVLKKHAKNLKVLMIRNDASQDWDLSVEATVTICQRAKNLEELACSYGARTVHTLIQFLNQLTSLRVFHTVQYRADDTCPFVLVQLRKFIVDSVVHHPDTQLEWIALDNSVERLVRRKPLPKPDKKGKGKAEAKQTTLMAILGSSSSATGIGGVGGSAMLTDQWTDSDDDDEELMTGLKVETVEGIRFSDIVGVRLFEKDVIAQRL